SDMGGDAMDRLAPRVSAAAWPTLVTDCAGNARLSPTGVLLVVVRLRRLRAQDFPGRRLYSRIRWLPLGLGRRRHVGLACAGDQDHRDLRLGPPGYACGGGRAARGCSGQTAWCSGAIGVLICATMDQSTCCASLRPVPARVSGWWCLRSSPGPVRLLSTTSRARTGR